MRRTSRGATIAAILLAAVCVAVCVFIVSENETSPWSAGPAPTSPPNYTEIEDGLWMGGSVEAPPPGTRAVLNLCEREDPYHCEIHEWKKIPDGAPAPSLDWLRERVKFVNEQRQAGVPIYIHCAAGVSRAGLVTTAYFMQKNKWKRDEALAFVRSKREVVNPNPFFMQLLLEWEAEVLGKER
jgi:hypothetical protein